jgi:hypothetical protein
VDLEPELNPVTHREPMTTMSERFFVLANSRPYSLYPKDLGSLPQQQKQQQQNHQINTPKTSRFV